VRLLLEDGITVACKSFGSSCVRAMSAAWTPTDIVSQSGRYTLVLFFTTPRASACRKHHLSSGAAQKLSVLTVMSAHTQSAETAFGVRLHNRVR
jgi:hypothetical protein